MVDKVLFSKESDEWETPQGLFDSLNEEFVFTLDPCATKENAKCSTFFTKEDDGLTRSWAGHTVFMNPPFSQVSTWMAKASSERDCIVVALVASRTDTAWWHETAMWSAEIRFIRGRLRFVGAPSSAPFPSAIVVFELGIYPPVVYSANKLGEILDKYTTTPALFTGRPIEAPALVG